MLSPAAVFPVKADGKIFIATPERVSYAIDAKSGKQLWRARGGRESVGLSPDKKHYYIKTMMDTVFAYSTADPVASGVATTPQIHWSSDAGFGYEIAPTPITSVAGEGKDGEGLLFVPTDKGNIIALNCKDGSIAWKHRFSSALINYIQPLGGNRILVSAMDGYVGVLEY
jgi:outer membrane protein assembly factor BamB